MTEKPRRLGRGLEALLAMAAPEVTGEAELRQLPLGAIRANPFQPRREFRPEELADLQASLKSNGLLQPVTVRPAQNGSGYELIAGERRLRAALSIGWSEISAIIKPVDDKTLLTLALVENLQRSNLNPIEEATGYRRLMEDFSLTQQQVAALVGKDRSTVANLLRLLSLPIQIRQWVEDDQLSVGHARALLAAKDESEMVELAREIVGKSLTVREVERLLRRVSSPRTRHESHRQSTSRLSPAGREIEELLRRRLQTDVLVSLTAPDVGTIKIDFYSSEDLGRIVNLLTGQPSEAE
ncbi:MAG: ParB/RepB/Spo0J family partition protein [Chloroflexota bacterium]